VRAVLAWSQLILLLAILLRFGGSGATERAVASRPLDVMAFSHADRVGIATDLLTTRYGITDGVLADDRVFRLNGGPPGLRVLSVKPGFELGRFRNHDFSEQPESVDSFDRFVSSRPKDSLLVLCVRSTWMPEQDAQAATLRRTLATLGARTSPWEGGSWCLLSLRLADGWVALAESHSKTWTTSLAFSVDPDLRRYRGYEAAVVQGALSSAIRLDLWKELSSSEYDPRFTSSLKAANVGALGLPAILAKPPRGPPVKISRFNHILWKDMRLGESPIFSAKLGLRKSAEQPADGVIFSLWVDGEMFRQRRLLPAKQPATPTWTPWTVNLSAFAGQTVDFELRVHPRGDPRADLALWGQPTLEWK
jgi:hypothetical protein